MSSYAHPPQANDAAASAGTPADETVLVPFAPETRRVVAFEGGPAVLTELMIAALLGPEGGVVALDPEGSSALLSVRRGNVTIGQATVTGDVAASAIGRLARMTGLDPLAERGTLGGPRTARLSVRVGRDAAEILVTLGATALGMSAELRLLTTNGRATSNRPAAQMKRCATCGAYQPTLRQRCEIDGGLLRELWDDPVVGGTIGPYLLQSLLGEGAMGRVFAAEHAFIERRVAIKVLRASMAKDPTFEGRFLFEARATSRLHHPNVVEVTDYGVLAGGSPFIVMERLDGASLDQRLARGKALEAPVALRLARAAALGLGAAHDAGVIHNDLKPSNVILLRGADDEAAQIKLIDFGAASMAGTGGGEMVVGTAAYMAPERIGGDPSEARSDVYSLGVMLHRMLSGSLPFDATDSTAMFAAHLAAMPKPLQSPFGVLPGRVVRVVTRALAKKPSERYQTMKQMVVDLDQALAATSAAGWRKWLP